MEMAEIAALINEIDRAAVAVATIGLGYLGLWVNIKILRWMRDSM